jgi:hypothetical protein
MESIVKPASLRRTLLGAVLTIGLLTLGCSSNDSSPTTKADAGKKDTGANGGAGGSGGSSARGGSGGSGGSSTNGGASGSGGSGDSGGSGGSGGSSATGGSGGGGGTSAAGGAGGLGGSSGSGGGTGGGGGSIGGTGGHDAGNTQIDGGGSLDAEASDALDAPILSNDGAASETGASNDGAVLIQLDTGTQDSEGVDSQAIDTTVVFLDAEAETSLVDAAADSAALPLDAGNCVQQIVSNGYSTAGASACSDCKENGSDLGSQCTAMIDCVVTHWPDCSSGSCHLDCLHNVSGDGVVDTCVTDLVHASCGAGF